MSACSIPRLGGDPLLFQHLFWFYSHPAVYIMILPGLGIVSEIIPVFARKELFGYKFVVWSSVSIAVIAFFVWGHHMFVSGQSLFASVVFSLLSYFVAVPSAIKVFNWLGTLHKGRIRFDAPMIYALGFIGLFTMGGITGLYLAALAADVHLHDTYFVIAHFHYIMVGGMVSAYFAALHYWWPKMTGKMYPEMIARAAALLMFLGFNLTFFPQYILGYLGMPRRYHAYPPEFQVLNVLSSAGATILAAAYLLPLFYLTLLDLPRRPCAGQSVGQPGPGVADTVAAIHQELRRDADRDRGPVRVFQARDTRCLRKSPRTRTSSTPTRAIRRKPHCPACGCSSPRKSCFSAA